MENNPTAVKPLSIVPHSNDEVTQGIKSTTKDTSRGKQTVDVDYDSPDESEASPLIRKNRNKDPRGATSSRSRVSLSILDRPTSERRPLQQKNGMKNNLSFCMTVCLFL